MCADHGCEYREKVRELEAENAKLRAELEKYKKPPKDSSNSSVAPSQDPYRKPYPKPEKSGKKPGGQPGHPGQTRDFCQTPDKIEPLYPTQCPYCGSEELTQLPQVKEARQEVSLPQVQAVVTEYRQCGSACRRCGKASWGEFPETIRAPQELGSDVEGLIGYLKVAHHQSNEKIQLLLKALYNLHLSRATVDAVLNRLSRQFSPELEQIKQGLSNSFVVGSDETGIRSDGKRGYQFVFQNLSFCLYKSGFSRGYRVIEETFGESFPLVWVSDRYSAQLKTPCYHQLCLAHLLRDCRYLVEAEQSQWAAALKQTLKDAIALRKSEGEEFDPLAVTTFRAIQRIEAQLEALFNKAPPQEQERKLYRGLQDRQDCLLAFLHDPDIPFDNNGSERALRNRKTHLKVMGTFRAEHGMKRVDTIASIIETAKRQGKNALDVLNGRIQLFPAEPVKA